MNRKKLINTLWRFHNIRIPRQWGLKIFFQSKVFYNLENMRTFRESSRFFVNEYCRPSALYERAIVDWHRFIDFPGRNVWPNFPFKRALKRAEQGFLTIQFGHMFAKTKHVKSINPLFFRLLETVSMLHSKVADKRKPSHEFPTACRITRVHYRCWCHIVLFSIVLHCSFDSAFIPLTPFADTLTKLFR